MDVRLAFRPRAFNSLALLFGLAAGNAAWAQSLPDSAYSGDRTMSVSTDASVDEPAVERTGWFKKKKKPEIMYSYPPVSDFHPAVPSEPPVTPPATTPETTTPEATTPSVPSTSDQVLAPGQQDFFGGADLASASQYAGAPESFVPNMIGDFIGVVYSTGPSPTPPPPPPGQPSGPVVESGKLSGARQRALTRYKVADWSSPRPQTRLLYSYNYFSEAFGTPGNIHRNVLGAEIAFLDQRMSFEIRGGIDTFTHFPGESDTTEPFDPRLIYKWAFVQTDAFTLCTGVGFGFPVGDKINGTPAGNWYFSPYVGWVLAPPTWRLFAQGFSQIDLPTADEDQGLWHNDVGIGFWLLQPDMTRWLAGVAPTAELHLYTPIGDAPTGAFSSLQYQDVLNATFGATFLFCNNVRIAMGYSMPILDEEDYNHELQFHADWRF